MPPDDDRSVSGTYSEKNGLAGYRSTLYDSKVSKKASKKDHYFTIN